MSIITLFLALASLHRLPRARIYLHLLPGVAGIASTGRPARGICSMWSARIAITAAAAAVVVALRESPTVPTASHLLHALPTRLRL